MDIENNYLTPVTKKFQHFAPPQKYHSICIWPDLLGFGSSFMNQNWKLSDEE